jgi:hypothetical protein
MATRKIAPNLERRGRGRSVELRRRNLFGRTPGGWLKSGLDAATADANARATTADADHEGYQKLEL